MILWLMACFACFLVGVVVGVALVFVVASAMGR